MRYLIIIFFSVLFLGACSNKKSKSDIDILFTPDTLSVGYTYWLDETGPFRADCDKQLSLVLMGSISSIKEPTTDPGPLYMAQEGIIKIEKVFKIKALDDKTYAGQKFLKTDCLYDSGLNLEDKVLVFCYDYDNGYTVNGHQAILKLNSFNEPIVEATRRFINHNEHPISLKKDHKIWASYGFKENLQERINCASKMKK